MSIPSNMELTPEQILSLPSKDFSIVDRIDELREGGIEVRTKEDISGAKQILDALDRGQLPDTLYRRLVLGLEYLARLRVERGNPITIATFEIVGDDPNYFAAWSYDVPVLSQQ